MKIIKIGDEIKRDGSIFKIIKKDGPFFISEQFRHNNYIGFEVGKTLTGKSWFNKFKRLQNETVLEEQVESYPGCGYKHFMGNCWSIWGERDVALKKAQDFFIKLKNKKESTSENAEDNSLKLCEGEFTIKQLRTLNKCGYNEAVLFLKKGLAQNKIKIIGEKQNAKGKPRKIYKKEKRQLPHSKEWGLQKTLANFPRC